MFCFNYNARGVRSKFPVIKINKESSLNAVFEPKSLKQPANTNVKP